MTGSYWHISDPFPTPILLACVFICHGNSWASTEVPCRYIAFLEKPESDVMTRNFRSNIHICFPWEVSQRILLIMTSLICTILLDFESSILFKCLQYLVSAENCICHDISAFTPSNCCHLFPSSLHMAIAVDYITDINQKSTDSFRFTCREGMLEGMIMSFSLYDCVLITHQWQCRGNH